MCICYFWILNSLSLNKVSKKTIMSLCHTPFYHILCSWLKSSFVTRIIFYVCNGKIHWWTSCIINEVYFCSNIISICFNCWLHIWQPLKNYALSVKIWSNLYLYWCSVMYYVLLVRTPVSVASNLRRSSIFKDFFIDHLQSKLKIQMIFGKGSNLLH